jgi:nicotinate phosphoribosyltransferase
MYAYDVIARADEGPPEDGGKPLLQEVMRDGKRLDKHPTLLGLRESFAQEFARLPASHKALRDPAQYRVETSPALERLRQEVTQQVVQKELGE